MKTLLHTLFHAIFWVWNLMFLVVVYLGILPLMGLPLLQATARGLVPIEFSLSLVALIAIPTICTLLGLWHFRRNPVQLMGLFYGVEAPLLLMCLLRLFVLRELTPASTQVLASIGICVFAFAGGLLFGYAERRSAIAWLQLFAHSLMLLVGLFTGVVLLFYAVPLAVWLVEQFFKFAWVDALWDVLTSEYLLTGFWWIALSLVLFALTCSLFVAMPSVMAAMYVYSGQSLLRRFAARHGREQGISGGLAIALFSLFLFVGLQQQPQIEAFKLLSRPPQTDRDRQALLAKSETIRAGLVNAYLANYRYLSTEKENNHIQVMYEAVFGGPKEFSRSLQGIYNALMSPFLYKGSATEIAKAETLYEQFFDTAIQKGERDAVNHALKSTYNRDEAKAGLLNFNQQKVWLKSQQITVKEQGDWADVELYEVYENQTPDQQEVFYSFSLPESAVVTGLWLGDSSDRNLRFPFVVSPRGAAQQVYNDQVRERVDPALLEQVGPRHYRLRAFPILPRAGTPDSLFGDTEQRRDRPTQMHLWLTYKVMRQPQGWALPHLGEKRNLYWTNQTKRIRNGKPTKALDAWVEPYLPAAKATPAIAHEIPLTNGYWVSAKPLRDRDFVLPQNQRFAVILDTSRSMGKRMRDVNQTFQWLREQGFANNRMADNDADLYLPAIAGTKPSRIDDISQFKPDKFTFYGSVQLREMLQQFEQLRGNTAYHGILLVTDEGSYELSNDGKLATPLTATRGTPTTAASTTPLPKLPAPLWFVHLAALPPAYDDGTLAAIETSRGGVATSVAEALRRMATKAALGPPVVSVVDGYLWQMQTVANDETSPQLAAQQPFAALAARQLILGLSQRNDMSQLTQLDAVHTIAQTFKVATPYSSLIVLVNDDQRQALKRAEAQADRFDREVESGKERLTQPHNPMNVAVPEPSAVLGLAVGVIGLAAWKRSTRRKPTFR
jgi:putative PEP-CTERM system integral membrane protein